jgi:hypothetical protein
MTENQSEFEDESGSYDENETLSQEDEIIE